MAYDTPTKLPWRKYCMFSPPSSNHTKPSTAVVSHDVGNARDAPEWASPSHWRQFRPWWFDCCVGAKSPTKLPRRKYCMFSPPSSNTTNREQPSSPVMGGMRTLRQNGHIPAISGGRGPGGLIVVSQRKPLKSLWQKYCIFSPPSSNHNKPRADVVTHDGGNAHVAPEWAYSRHGRR